MDYVYVYVVFGKICDGIGGGEVGLEDEVLDLGVGGVVWYV